MTVELETNPVRGATQELQPNGSFLVTNVVMPILAFSTTPRLRTGCAERLVNGNVNAKAAIRLIGRVGSAARAAGSQPGVWPQRTTPSQGFLGTS